MHAFHAASIGCDERCLQGRAIWFPFSFFQHPTERRFLFADLLYSPARMFAFHSLFARNASLRDSSGHAHALENMAHIVASLPLRLRTWRVVLAAVQMTQLRLPHSCPDLLSLGRNKEEKKSSVFSNSSTAAMLSSLFTGNLALQFS